MSDLTAEQAFTAAMQAHPEDEAWAEVTRTTVLMVAAHVRWRDAITRYGQARREADRG